MKVSYCSLNDAFKTPGFSKIEIPDTVKETFEVSPTESEIEATSCENIMEHINTCKECSMAMTKSSNIDIAFNDILNMILIVLLVWIIVYKPRI